MRIYFIAIKKATSNLNIKKQKTIMDNNNQLTPKNSEDKLNSSKNLKTYKILAPNGDIEGDLTVDPMTAACRPKIMAPLVLMLAHSSGRESLGDGEFRLLAIALERNRVTADEVFNAFWKAYADPYVSQGKIEFRHLWKHIEQSREDKPFNPEIARRVRSGY